MSSKHNDKKHVRHLKSDNIEIMIYDQADEVIEERLQSLLSRYQIGLETLIKSSNFVFNCIYLLCC